MSASGELAGSEIGRYRIVSLIGKGGMGEVYDAVDSSLGRHVALKILDSAVVSDPRRVSRFVQEARSASALNHPHVVSIYEIGDSAGIRFIAMEKIDGSNLRDVLSSGRMPLQRTVELLAQITEAVAAAHEAGIIHRDLKPENIMVSRSGYAKVLDFGLAKLQPETFASSGSSLETELKSTDSGTILGTVGYMSPEQAQGRPVDSRSDIFSVGCILYEAIAGHRAFHSSNPIDTLHKIIYDEPRPLRELAPDTPAELVRITRKAMAKDPSQRYQSATELALDLRNAQREPQSGASRPHPDRWIAVAAALAIIAVISATVFLSRRAAAPAKSSLQVQRLTNTGDVINAAISPDARYMAYVRYNENGQSLWLRQLATNQDLGLIVPPANRDMSFWGVAFTPDNNAVLYVTRSPRHVEGTLHRMSVLGGRGEDLLNGIDSGISCSPDGSRIAYLRQDFPKPGESAVMVASSDGSGARAVAVRRPPDYFVPIWFAGCSWSPDGTSIAAAVAHRDSSERSSVVILDVRDGTQRVVADKFWPRAGRTLWMPDGSGIIVPAGDAELDLPLWFVPLDGERPHLITHDADYYRSPTINGKGDQLLSVRMTLPIAEVWNVPLTGAQPRKIATSVPWGGVSWLTNGRIAYSTDGMIVTVDAATEANDGPAELVHDRFQNASPHAFDGGIVYATIASGGMQVCMASSSGGGRKVIASGVPLGISRDGSKLLYSQHDSFSIRDLRTGRDTRIGFVDRADSAGGNLLSPSSALSPDGERVAVIVGPYHRRELQVISTTDLKVLWKVPVNAGFVSLRWTPDGSSLLATGIGNDLANVFRVNEDGTLTKLTNFYGQLALAFDLSPDGKTLAVVRSQWQRDAVLITGFR